MHLSVPLPIYLSGALVGICMLVMMLSILVGYGYSERMLWWHAATLATAALAQPMGQSSLRIYAAFWAPCQGCSVVLAASRAIASTLRSQDSAARLCGNQFGVIAEGIAEGATNTLDTQILANGLRAEEWGLCGSWLQFHIAFRSQ